MSAGSAHFLPELERLLSECRQRVRYQQALRGGAETLAVILFSIAAACFADWLLVLPSVLRLFLLIILTIASWSVFWLRLIRPMRTELPAEELGAAIDLQYPGLQEAVSTLVTSRSADVRSDVLLTGLQQSVTRQLESVRPDRVIGFETAQKILRFTAGGTSILACLLLFWPDRSLLLLNRLVTPFANLESATSLYFEVPDGNRLVAAGSRVTIAAIPRWRSAQPGLLPEEVFLEAAIDTADFQPQPLYWNPAQERFETALQDIRDDLRYRIRSGAAVSQWYQLLTAEPPQIDSAVLIETSPAYSGRGILEYDGVVGEISVFERSDVRIQLQFSQPVETCLIRWIDWTPLNSVSSADSDSPLQTQEEGLLPEEIAALAAEAEMATEQRAQVTAPADLQSVLAEDGRSAVIHFTATGSGRFEFSLAGTAGLPNPTEPFRRLQLTTDSPPTLEVTGISDGLEVRPNDSLALRYSARDDFGLGLVEFTIRRNEDEPLVFPANPPAAGERNLSGELLIDLGQLSLSSGDVLEVIGTVADRRPQPGPQIVHLGPWQLRISETAAAIGQNALAEANQQLLQSLREILRELEQDLTHTQQLSESTQREWGPDQQQQSAELSEMQQTRGNRLQQLGAETATHPLMQKQAGDLSDQADELRHNVAPLLQQAADSELIASQRTLQDAAAALRNSRDQLARTIDEIHQLAELEQELTELNRLALNARQLASDSEKFRDQREAGTPSPGQTEQEFQDQLFQEETRLQTEQQQLSADLTDLLQRQQELLQSARESQLQQAELIGEGLDLLAAIQDANASGILHEAEAEQATALMQSLLELQRQLMDLKSLADDAEVRLPLPDLQQLSRVSEQVQNELPEQAAGLLQQFSQLLQAAFTGLPQPQDPVVTDDPLAQLQDRSEQISAQLAELQQLLTPTTAETAAAEQDSPAARVLDPLQRAVAAAAELLQQPVQQPANPQQRQSLAATAAELQQGLIHARSGQFAEAAELLRQATGRDAMDLLPDQRLRQQISHLADQLQQLQLDRSQRLAIQRDSQQTIAEQSQLIPEMLQDLAERLQLPALGLNQQAQSASQAAISAQAAADQAGTASEQLQQRLLLPAGQQAELAAQMFEQAMRLSMEASSGPRDPRNPVPVEVGKDVSEALHSLQQAAEMMAQQQSQMTPADPGDGAQNQQAGNTPQDPSQQAAEAGTGAEQPGAEQQMADSSSGQPSDSAGQDANGQQSPGNDPTSQELSRTAKSLQQAASRSIPSQFTPGQLSSDSAQNRSNPSALGNTAEFDGIDPLSRLLQGTRGDWGRLQDQLDEEIQDAGREILDREYSELIRRYRRNLAGRKD